MVPVQRRVAALAIAAACLVGVVGCGSSNGGDSRPQVLCTTSIIADAAHRVGGEWIRVETLMGPGIDPHRHQPTASDAAKLRDAKLIFHNGLHLEGKITDILEKSGPRAVAVTKGIPVEQLRKADEEAEGLYDPHVWFDVKLWKQAVEVVRDELCAFDPTHADSFKANAAAYLAELDALDAEVRAKAESLPQDRRVLVTSHDAFGYFGRAYGFEVYGLQGVSTAAEVNTVQRDALAKLLATKNVRAVFTETLVPPEGLKAVLETAKKGSGREVRLIDDGALYSDALGPADSPGGTYSGMIRHNVITIVDALSK